MTSISAKSFAKINLSLKVLKLRKDGFHDIESVMQNISLYDELTISEAEKDIDINCSYPLVPLDSSNICYKAALLLMNTYKIKAGIKISINKNIPLQAGLGGGSSNAAAVLIALNNLWGLKMSSEVLIKLASTLGSDVPFFIIGGKAICSGRGEIIEKLPDDKKQNIILIKPEVSVPTKWAYQEWDKIKSQILSTKSQINSKSQILNKKQNNGNDLEDVVIGKYPVIAEIKDELFKAGCTSAQMTGSGSAVFGIAPNKECSLNTYASLKDKYKKTYLLETTDVGVEIDPGR